MVLSDVGFRFRAKLRAKGFLGAGLAKQKTLEKNFAFLRLANNHWPTVRGEKLCFFYCLCVFRWALQPLWIPPGLSVADEI